MLPQTPPHRSIEFSNSTVPLHNLDEVRFIWVPQNFAPNEKYEK